MAKGSKRIIPNGKPCLVEEQQTAQAKLRAAVFNGVGESDVKDIVAGIVKRAKDGDAQATKYFFEYILGGRVTTAVQNNVVVNNAEQPANDVPGSRGKLDVMRERAANGEELFHQDDIPFGDEN